MLHARMSTLAFLYSCFHSMKFSKGIFVPPICLEIFYYYLIEMLDFLNRSVACVSCCPAVVKSGWSVNLATLFLGRPIKQLTSTQYFILSPVTKCCMQECQLSLWFLVVISTNWFFWGMLVVALTLTCLEIFDDI